MQAILQIGSTPQAAGHVKQGHALHQTHLGRLAGAQNWRMLRQMVLVTGRR